MWWFPDGSFSDPVIYKLCFLISLDSSMPVFGLITFVFGSEIPSGKFQHKQLIIFFHFFLQLIYLANNMYQSLSSNSYSVMCNNFNFSFLSHFSLFLLLKIFLSGLILTTKGSFASILIKIKSLKPIAYKNSNVNKEFDLIICLFTKFIFPFITFINTLMLLLWDLHCLCNTKYQYD